ncbi:hypothetical protein M758_4G163200, partial [Ceratodon purpureus]
QLRGRHRGTPLNISTDSQIPTNKKKKKTTNFPNPIPPRSQPSQKISHSKFTHHIKTPASSQITTSPDSETCQPSPLQPQLSSQLSPAELPLRYPTCTETTALPTCSSISTIPNLSSIHLPPPIQPLTSWQLSPTSLSLPLKHPESNLTKLYPVQRPITL